MRRTFSAKQSAVTASSRLAEPGETHTTTVDSHPPPKAPASSRVSFEFLHGTCDEPRRRASTTVSRLCKDLLMLCVSRRTLPSAPLRFTRSRPARSTNVSLPSPIPNTTMTCDRELVALAMVEATWRRARPLRMVTRSEAKLGPGTSRAPSIQAIAPAEPPAHLQNRSGLPLWHQQIN